METKNNRIRNFGNKICLCNNRFRVIKIDQNIFYEHGLQEMAVQIPIHCIRSYKEVVRLNNCLSSSQNIFVISQNITIDGGFKSV